MAQFNANIKVVAPNPIDDRYLSLRTISGAQQPYSGCSEVNTTIDELYRYPGLTVLIESGGTWMEYWYASGITDTDLVVKTMGSAGTITGGTNGLSTSGANIVLGGDLDNNTIIDGQDYDFDIINVNSFSVSTSGLTALVGIDTTGILLEFSGTSVLLENNSGFVYNADYSTTFVDESLVSKKYVDAIATGLQPKTAVWVSTSTGDTNIDLSGGTFGGTIDGITIVDGDRVLIKNQNGIIPDIENGIYIYSADTNTFYRSPDFNGTPEGEVSQGALVPVLTGSTNRNTLWVLITADPIVDVTPLSFTPFSTPGNYTGENGVNVVGTVISLNVPTIAGDHIEWDGTQFNVIPSGITSGYTTLSQFNTYTGDTEIRLTAIEDDIVYISGITDTKLDNDIFTGYTASTEVRLTGIEDDIDYLSGVTESKLDTSVFTGYTASTEIRLTDIENDIQYISGQTLTISIFTGYTASTEIRLTDIENDIQYISGITDNKLDTSIFAAYTGTTQPILNAALTGATNGLTATGRVVKLGGALSNNTSINLNGNNLMLSGATGAVCSFIGNTSTTYSCASVTSSSISLERQINTNCAEIDITNTSITTCTQGGNIYLNSTCNNGTGGCIIITAFSGASYAGNYCSTNINNPRWIPDKEYVDGRESYECVLIPTSYGTSGYTLNNITEKNVSFVGVSGITQSQYIYLYSSPICGKRITIADICGQALSNPIWIHGNGNNIAGNGCALINTNYGAITVLYNGTFWSPISFVN